MDFTRTFSPEVICPGKSPFNSTLKWHSNIPIYPYQHSSLHRSLSFVLSPKVYRLKFCPFNNENQTGSLMHCTSFKKGLPQFYRSIGQISTYFLAFKAVQKCTRTIWKGVNILHPELVESCCIHHSILASILWLIEWSSHQAIPPNIRNFGFGEVHFRIHSIFRIFEISASIEY